MTPLLAQIESVPAGQLKWTLIVLIALLGVGATIVSIFVAFRKNKVEIEPQPVEVRKTPKRFNYDLAEERHSEMERRVTSLENWRIALTSKLEEDKVEIICAGDQRMQTINQHIETVRTELNQYVRDTERTLGRIESRLPDK